MNDKKLLKLAAKAADIPLKPDFMDRFDYYMQDRLMWNPLTDDGDALRLAVSLGLHVMRFGGMTTVRAIGLDGGCDERDDGDQYAATRRAIVRAAAEIGKGMQ